MPAQRDYNSAAAELYQWMDHELQQAFYVCYQNFGKISTKKLVACLGHANITRELVSRTEGELQIPQIRRNNKSTDELAFAKENDFVIVTEHGGVMNNDIRFDCPHWLNNMPIGPGVSPCVDIACRIQLASHYAASTGKNDESASIGSFSFYRTLCENASELRTLVEKYEVDLNEVFGVAETPFMG